MYHFHCVSSVNIMKYMNFLYLPSARAGRWTIREHIKFLDAIQIYGRNWVKVSRYIISRTSTQVRSHAQKYFIRESKGCTMKGLTEDQLMSKNTGTIMRGLSDQDQFAIKNTGTIMRDSSNQYGEGILFLVNYRMGL